MSHMLEQAIVDAKALKEAAFNSARDALVEKYAPEIREAVDAMLEQDEEDPALGDEEVGFELGGLPDETEGGGESELDIPLAATDGEKLCPCPEEEEEIEIDFGELEKQMRAAEEAPEEHSELVSDLELSEPEEEEPLAEDEELSLSEEDLYEMLATKQNPVDKKVVEAKKNKSPTKAKESRDISQEIKKSVLAETKKIESGLLKENKKLLSDKKSLIKENTNLKTKNDEFKSKILELTETLQDLNLSNAKLFYTNKVLTSASLNERQKNKVVEAISRAGNVDEAKTVYETLINSVGTSSDNRRPESLSEVVGRNRTGFIKSQPKAVDPEKNRWQALAGIKK